MKKTICLLQDCNQTEGFWNYLFMDEEGNRYYVLTYSGTYRFRFNDYERDLEVCANDVLTLTQRLYLHGYHIADPFHFLVKLLSV